MHHTPVLLLTTTGRKTGKKRTTPVLYLKDANTFVVVASDSGAQKNPLWWLNLRATPQATVEVGRKTLHVVLHKKSTAEREAQLPAFVPDLD